MGAGGGDRRRKGKDARHRHSSSSRNDDDDDDDDDDTGEPEELPSKFKLSGDDTGSGIDYNVLDEESWQRLEVYCKKWGIKQAHLESIYSRFSRTIIRTEHLDFTAKPQFHASLDFLADEFMATAGEFAAQVFLQTWFLRPKRGLPPPEDRRCVDFARLVIMCCDLARLGDYELLVNLWACVLHRFGHLLPNGTVDLDTRLNTELVHEVIAVIHATPDKKIDLLVETLLSEADEEQLQPGVATAGDAIPGVAIPEDAIPGSAITRDAIPGGALPGGAITEVSGQSGGQGREETRGGGAVMPRRRYLVLRNVLRFSFQHPPLLFPVVQFQRVLRSKIIGSRYWLRRRKPAADRGIDLNISLGLSDAYNDIFDRIRTRRDAWAVATGQLLLRALEARTMTPTSDRRSVEVGGGTRGRGGGVAGGGGGGGGGGGRGRGRGGGGGGGERNREDGGEERGGGEGAGGGGEGGRGGGGGGSGGEREASGEWEAGGERRGGEGDGGEGRDGDCEDLGGKQCRQLLENCLNIPKWYNQTKEAASPPASLGGAAAARAVGIGIGGIGGIGGIPSLAATANRFSAAAKSAVTIRPRVAAVNKNEEHFEGVGSSSPSNQQQLHQARSSATMPSDTVGGGGDGGGGAIGTSTTAARSSVPSKKVAGPGRAAIGTSTTVNEDDSPSKTCAVCLKELCASVMCRACACFAASAFKDTHGSRRGRIILVPHGHSFGIREEDFLSREGGSVRRWTRLFDDSAGAHFFYNVYYDSSVWKDGIELPEPEAVAKASRRRRKGGGGGGGGVVINAPSPTPRKKTPSVNPSTRSSRDATNSTIATPPAATAAIAAGNNRARSAANTPSSPQRSAVAPRAGLRSRGDDTSRIAPEMVLDAHKRPYPAFRLVFKQIQDAVEAGGGGLRGVTPGTPDKGTGRPGSRAATGQPVSRPVSRAVSKMGTPLAVASTTK